MLMLIAGGSLSTGSHDPYCGTLMPLGPSTPSVGVDMSPAGGVAVNHSGWLAAAPWTIVPRNGPEVSLLGSTTAGVHHEAAWRSPAASTWALTDIRYYKDLAQKAEAGSRPLRFGISRRHAGGGR